MPIMSIGLSKKLCPFSYPLFPLFLRSACAASEAAAALRALPWRRHRLRAASELVRLLRVDCRVSALSLSADLALPARATLLTFRSVSSSDGRNSRLFCESILPVATTLANGLKNTERERKPMMIGQRNCAGNQFQCLFILYIKDVKKTI